MEEEREKTQKGSIKSTSPDLERGGHDESIDGSCAAGQSAGRLTHWSVSRLRWCQSWWRGGRLAETSKIMRSL